MGSVADPGFMGVAAGSDVIMWPPVSVCHHVSTIGVRPEPMTSQYHLQQVRHATAAHPRAQRLPLRCPYRQASGLMGSPTVPSTRKDDRLYLRGTASPKRMSARMAVGAV